jgi:hypothetical protein
MKVNWDVVVGSVISGVVVATFSYYFLSKSEISSSVSLEYHYGNIGFELVELADHSLKEYVEESIRRSKAVQPFEASLKFDFLASEISNFSLSNSEISRFNAVENLVLTNNDQSREVTLRVRGLDFGVVAWTSKTAGRIVKRGAFEQEVVLQPSEQIEIRNYSEFPNRWSQNGSADVLVFVNNVLMVAENRKTNLDFMLGHYMKAYPFAFMVLIFSGAIFLLLLALSGLASVFRSNSVVLDSEKPSAEQLTNEDKSKDNAAKTDQGLGS